MIQAGPPQPITGKYHSRRRARKAPCLNESGALFYGLWPSQDNVKDGTPAFRTVINAQAAVHKTTYRSSRAKQTIAGSRRTSAEVGVVPLRRDYFAHLRKFILTH